MTPPNIDLGDLAVRIAELVQEKAQEAGTPRQEVVSGKKSGQTDREALLQKLKREAVIRRHLQFQQQQQLRLLQRFETYRKAWELQARCLGKSVPDNTAASPSKLRDGIELGFTMFFPYLLPFRQALGELAASRPFGLNISSEALLEGVSEFIKQTKESRQAFEQSLEGAIWNPKSLEELVQGSRFVIEEETLNEMVASLIASGPSADKLRNVHIAIDGDRLKITGEYNCPIAWVAFSAQLEFEQRDGKTEGALTKIEAAGFDLGDFFKSDILQAFGKLGLSVPEDADLQDLSWIQLPGIRRLEITHDKILLEREPPPSGPA
ncbi:MAG: hypothetical protein U1F66_02195 [bacterium]